MKFYVSCRPIKIGQQLHTPKEHLKHNFKGINFSFKLIAYNNNIDGRMLYEIDINDSYNQEEKDAYKEVFLEGLQPFSCHLKTLASAEALAEALSGKSFSQNGDAIECTLNPVRD